MSVLTPGVKTTEALNTKPPRTTTEDMDRFKKLETEVHPSYINQNGYTPIAEDDGAITVDAPLKCNQVLVDIDKVLKLGGKMYGTQQRLEKASGITNATFLSMKRGRPIRYSTSVKLAAVFGLDVPSICTKMGEIKE